MMKGFSLLEVLIALTLTSTLILVSDFALSKAAQMNANISVEYAKLFQQN